ncbi:MAG: hypothetical protein MI919_00695, partial [Holophagales bacterium]|nr:hypothetical protein [Holophagales bacterium]
PRESVEPKLETGEVRPRNALFIAQETLRTRTLDRAPAPSRRYQASLEGLLSKQIPEDLLI